MNRLDEFIQTLINDGLITREELTEMQTRVAAGEEDLKDILTKLLLRFKEAA